MIHAINSLSPPQQTAAAGKTSGNPGTGFDDMLSSYLQQVNESQLSGEQAIRDLQSGKAQHLHEVMIAVEQADISLRMAVQLRNKALTAYEEIMRMQL